jgi:hypothetical protein
MNTVKEFLTHKGWLTSILGMAIGSFASGKALGMFFARGFLEYQELVTY